MKGKKKKKIDMYVCSAKISKQENKNKYTHVA